MTHTRFPCRPERTCRARRRPDIRSTGRRARSCTGCRGERGCRSSARRRCPRLRPFGAGSGAGRRRCRGPERLGQAETVADAERRPSAATTRSAVTREPSASSTSPDGCAPTALNQHDLDVVALGDTLECLVQVRAGRDDKRIPGRRGATADQTAMAVADLPGGHLLATRDRLVERADRLQRAEAVLPKPDPRPKHAQIGRLVHADVPAALGKRARGEQACQPGTDDLGRARSSWSNSLSSDSGTSSTASLNSSRASRYGR